MKEFTYSRLHDKVQPKPQCKARNVSCQLTL